MFYFGFMTRTTQSLKELQQKRFKKFMGKDQLVRQLVEDDLKSFEMEIRIWTTWKTTPEAEDRVIWTMTS